MYIMLIDFSIIFFKKNKSLFIYTVYISSLSIFQGNNFQLVLQAHEISQGRGEPTYNVGKNACLYEYT